MGKTRCSDEKRVEFGSRIVAIRERRGITQRWLAREAGISAAFLCDVERGKQSVGADTLERLADTLGFTMDDLWRGTGRCEWFEG